MLLLYVVVIVAVAAVASCYVVIVAVAGVAFVVVAVVVVVVRCCCHCSLCCCCCCCHSSVSSLTWNTPLVLLPLFSTSATALSKYRIGPFVGMEAPISRSCAVRDVARECPCNPRQL